MNDKVTKLLVQLLESHGVEPDMDAVTVTVRQLIDYLVWGEELPEEGTHQYATKCSS